MRGNSLERLAPLSGVIFAVLLTALFILTSNSPDANDKTVDVVNYWTNHDSKEIVASLMGGLAVVAFVWFAGTLRSAYRDLGGESGRLAGIAYGGALVFAVGGAIASSLEFAAADTAGDVPAQVTQTLSVLDSDVFLTFAAGIVIFQAANARLILGYGGLPRWLGYFSILLVIVSLTPVGFIAFPGTILWVLIAAILLYMQAEGPAAVDSAPAS
jgi:hypothetical protein